MTELPSIEPDAVDEMGEALAVDAIEEIASIEDEDDVEDNNDDEDGVDDEDDDDYKDTTKKKRRKKNKKKKQHSGALLRSASVKKVTAISKCSSMSINLALSVSICMHFYYISYCFFITPYDLYNIVRTLFSMGPSLWVQQQVWRMELHLWTCCTVGVPGWLNICSL